MHQTNKPVIGVTCGDLNGIGIELIIKTFSDNRILELCTPVVFPANTDQSNLRCSQYVYSIKENSLSYRFSPIF